MKQFKTLIWVALIGTLMSSCLDKDPSGAHIFPPSEADLALLQTLEIAEDSVDFTESGINLNVNFSRTVSFVVKMRGLESRAERTLNFSDKDIDVAWYGEHEGLSFFKKGEQVVIEFSFLGSLETKTDTITITGANDFASANVVHLTQWSTASSPADSANWLNELGTLGFEGPVGGLGYYLGNNENEEATPTGQIISRGVIPSPEPLQGDSAYRMSGYDPNNGSYVTGFDHTLAGVRRYMVFPEDPSQVWFNVYVYGTGNANTDLVVEIREADEGARRFTPGQHDGIQAFINTDHVGWKLFSFRYDALPFSTYAPGGGSGNKTYEPQYITTTVFNLQTVEGSNGEFVEAIIDYPVFTIGGPFDPTIHFRKPQN